MSSISPRMLTLTARDGIGDRVHGLDNLVRNAVRYNRVGGHVASTVEVEDAAGPDWTAAHTARRVTDSGRGIPDGTTVEVRMPGGRVTTTHSPHALPATR